MMTIISIMTSSTLRKGIFEMSEAFLKKTIVATSKNNDDEILKKLLEELPNKAK